MGHNAKYNIHRQEGQIIGLSFFARILESDYNSVVRTTDVPHPHLHQQLKFKEGRVIAVLPTRFFGLGFFLFEQR